MSHMTLDDRVYIQEGLDCNKSPSTIERLIAKNRSTVLREIMKRRVFKGKRFEGAKEPCAHKANCVVYGLCKDRRCGQPCRNCHVCKDICPDYFPSSCVLDLITRHMSVMAVIRLLPVHLTSITIYASSAHNDYQETLISSREGINQDPESLQKLDDIVSPLLLIGQTVCCPYFCNSR